MFYFQDEEGEIIDSYSHVMDSLQDTLTDEEADTTTADAEARVRKSFSGDSDDSSDDDVRHLRKTPAMLRHEQCH